MQPSTVRIFNWQPSTFSQGGLARRRMIDLLCCFQKRDHPIRINQEFRLDLEWWHTFLPSWNGVCFWLFPGLNPSPDVEVISDASGIPGLWCLLLWRMVLCFLGSPSGTSLHTLQGTFPSGDSCTGLGSHLASSACLISFRQQGSSAHHKHQVL